MGLVAPWHVGSSRTRAPTRVPCIDRWILNHCATREVSDADFLEVSGNPCLTIGISDMSEWNVSRVRFPLNTGLPPPNERNGSKPSEGGPCWWARFILRFKTGKGWTRCPHANARGGGSHPGAPAPTLRHIAPFKRPCSLGGRASSLFQVKGFNESLRVHPISIQLFVPVTSGCSVASHHSCLHRGLPLSHFQPCLTWLNFIHHDEQNNSAFQRSANFLDWQWSPSPPYSKPLWFYYILLLYTMILMAF